MRPLKKIIYLNSLRHNWQLLQAKAAAQSAALMAVVKANAYGHDAAVVAQALADMAPCYAVACIEEALALRELGIRQPIVLLEGIFSPDEVALCVAQGLQPVVHEQRQLAWLKAANLSLDTPLRAWIKIDSGMHRLGFAASESQAVFAQAQALQAVQWQGVMSHFACADSEDLAHARQQCQVLQGLVLPQGWRRSYANSAALWRLPELSGDWVRAGIMLYGLSPFERQTAADLGLQAVMSLQTEILATHFLRKGESAGYAQGFVAPDEGYLATIALGYGDGWARRIDSGKVPVWIGGQCYFLVGRVAMDMCLVWLGKESFAAGEAVELFGAHLPAEVVAEAAGTIPYTLTTMLTPRVRLEVVDG